MTLQLVVSYPWDERSAPDMRLLEISQAPEHSTSPDRTLVMLLNYLLGKSDGKSARIPTASLLALMQNAGLPNTYDDLDNMLKSSEAAKKLIKKLDPNTAIIGKASQPADIAYPAGDEQDVANMASRAANKRVKD